MARHLQLDNLSQSSWFCFSGLNDNHAGYPMRTKQLVLFSMIIWIFSNRFANGEDINVAELFTLGNQAVRSIESIQFDADVPVPQSRGQLHFAAVRDLFRIELRDRDKPRQDRIATFDGQLLRVFDETHRVIGSTTEQKEVNLGGISNPLVMPYRWLFEGADPQTWAALRNPATWENKLKDVIGATRLADGTVEVSVRRHRPKELVNHVTFVKMPSVFPVRYTTHNDQGKEEFTLIVEDSTRVVTDALGNEASIPLTISTRLSAYDKIKEESYRIAPESVAVNKDISLDQFALPDVAAKETYNADTDTLVDLETGKITTPRRDSEELLRKAEEDDLVPLPGKSRALILAVSVILLVLTVCCVIWFSNALSFKKTQRKEGNR